MDSETKKDMPDFYINDDFNTKVMEYHFQIHNAEDNIWPYIANNYDRKSVTKVIVIVIVASRTSF